MAALDLTRKELIDPVGGFLIDFWLVGNDLSVQIYYQFVNREFIQLTSRWSNKSRDNDHMTIRDGSIYDPSIIPEWSESFKMTSTSINIKIDERISKCSSENYDVWENKDCSCSYKTNCSCMGVLAYESARIPDIPKYLNVDHPNSKPSRMGLCTRDALKTCFWFSFRLWKVH